MKIEILEIFDRGTLASERVVLKVLEDCDLEFFMVVDTTYKSPTTISNEHRHSYWFPPKQVKAGDFVLLYTRTGKNETKNHNGKDYHLFFWNSGQNIWNNTGDTGLLFQIDAWKAHLVNK